MSLKRTVYSILLLLLLLVPMVQREVHTFSHKDDIACSARDTKHLHEQHHYCKLCDFSIPAHFVAVLSFEFSIRAVVSRNLIQAPEQTYTALTGTSGPPRAPPFGTFDLC